MAAWFAELYQVGKHDWALKVLLDLCHEEISYDHPVAHALLTQLLGNKPAGRWVKYRQVEAKKVEEHEDWEKILAQSTKL